MTPKIRASIKDGKLVCDKSLWELYLSGFSGEVAIKIEQWKNDRTLNQNCLIWKLLQIIDAETGNLSSDIHEIAKRKFLPPRFIKMNGYEYKICGSTTKLNTKQFSEYTEKISIWTGIPIPTKNEI